ncbi:hypothetical protein KM043_009895 [Ampulex compressa]|nr:hypothetical protein KM043_009895 [Ampulex compressa]
MTSSSSPRREKGRRSSHWRKFLRSARASILSAGPKPTGKTACARRILTARKFGLAYGQLYVREDFPAAVFRGDTTRDTKVLTDVRGIRLSFEVGWKVLTWNKKNIVVRTVARCFIPGK